MSDPQLAGYTPWLPVPALGADFHVVRDHIGSPFGPRLWHQTADGRPVMFDSLREAWRVAHQLNAWLYASQPGVLQPSPDRVFGTITGRNVCLVNPDPADIDIIDIARSLSMKCRFSGHVREWYSVAQHCVHISDRCIDRKWGLLHDAAECYTGDCPRPWKRTLREWAVREQPLFEAIAERFGLAWPIPEDVLQADERMLNTEWRDLRIVIEHEMAPVDRAEPYESPIHPWQQRAAEKEFIQRYVDLFEGGDGDTWDRYHRYFGHEQFENTTWAHPSV